MHNAKNIKNILLAGILVILITNIFSQDKPALKTEPADKWVDSIMQTLSLDEMIAQLMIIRANNPGKEYFDIIDQYIREYNIGGVTFFGGHPGLQSRQVNKWQSMSKTPLFVSIDGEWGPAMRLDSMISSP